MEQLRVHSHTMTLVDQVEDNLLTYFRERRFARW